LLEEAVHLLRLSPWSVLGAYYLGSLPFVLGLLYFWADMSRGSAAYEHCAPAAFGVSVLFLWMKTWQAIFARRLNARITGRSVATMTLSGFCQAALNQSILQPSGLFLLPLSLLFVLPFGWFYAFYQNITAFGAEGVAPKHVFQRAARQAQLWPKQNHFLLAALLLFGVIVFLDVAIGLATVPSLLKMWFGIETVFTRSPWGLFNTTFVATVGALTYLCLDPLVKAAYLLRCFYGESLHTGEDLRAELRQFVPGARAAALVLLPVLLLVKTMAGQPGERIDGILIPTPDRSPGVSAGGRAHPELNLHAFSSSPRDAGVGRGPRRGVALHNVPPLPGPLLHPMEERGSLRYRLRQVAVGTDQASSQIPNSELRAPNSGIAPPDLDRSIEQVLSRREFNWRLPREKPADDDAKGFFAAFMDGLIETLRSWVKAIGRAVKAVARWIADAFDWLREKIFGKSARAQEVGAAGKDWIVSLQGLMLVLLILAACAVAILFYRTWRRRGTRQEIASEAVAPVPDLADEGVTASQLPEDDWLRLARELMGKGDLRLALRAFYLAGLAHLAQREMIRIAKFKSNRDYEQELRRRARAVPELQAAFAENVGIFDRVWYGLHDVSQEGLQRFQINLDKIKAC
jgi:hypothetical protein